MPFIRSSRRALSSLADAATAALKSGEANAAKASPGEMPGPSLIALQALTAAMPPKPVSIQMLLASARDTSARARLANANFLKNEMCSRRAHILKLLHLTPQPMTSQPAVRELGGVYWERLRDMLQVPEVKTEEEEAAFQQEMIALNDRIIAQWGLEEQMSLDALSQMQEEAVGEGLQRLPLEARLAVDRHLDAIFLARIGLRFLLEHYVATVDPNAGNGPGTQGAAAAAGGHSGSVAGIINTKCNPIAICHELAEETRNRLTEEYGSAPDVEIRGDASHTFTFVPAHLRFVLGPLIKNSSVATLRHHHNKVKAGTLPEGAELPPVRVICAVSDEAVQFKLVDEAGGIRRSSLTNVWSYRALDSKWWKARDGLSLPLARLYCKYFGGSLDLVPMEGFGTDCYVSFNRLAHKNSEHIIPVDSNEEDPNRVGGGLLDAQARRGGGDATREESPAKIAGEWHSPS